MDTVDLAARIEGVAHEQTHGKERIATLAQAGLRGGRALENEGSVIDLRSRDRPRQPSRATSQKCTRRSGATSRLRAKVLGTPRVRRDRARPRWPCHRGRQTRDIPARARSARSSGTHDSERCSPAMRSSRRCRAGRAPTRPLRPEQSSPRRTDGRHPCGECRSGCTGSPGGHRRACAPLRARARIPGRRATARRPYSRSPRPRAGTTARVAAAAAIAQPCVVRVRCIRCAPGHRMVTFHECSTDEIRRSGCMSIER